LYGAFKTHLCWKRHKFKSIEDSNTPGLYVIYNKDSFTTYVGESHSMEKRFFQHYNLRQNGSHYNKGLQDSCNYYGINSFFFFVYSYGNNYKCRSFWKDREKTLIKSWPGPAFNIKDRNSRSEGGEWRGIKKK